MIRIKKLKKDTPDILLSKGAEEITALKKMTKAKLLAYKYKSALYGGKTVKEKLKELQHDKCCFCEARVSVVSHGDVEHFRPKAGWVQQEKDKLSKPGYYWLAYDFSNLFLSCQICNQKFKKNYFPLANPASRASNHKKAITKERPLIIDPGKSDPTKFLTFNKEIIVAVNNNKKGLETIKRTGLDRPELNRERFEYLALLEELAKLARNGLPNGAAARAHFKERGSQNSVYSAMVRANFPDLVK
jgi:uncharacterized protein (TIGR02646 family)